MSNSMRAFLDSLRAAGPPGAGTILPADTQKVPPAGDAAADAAGGVEVAARGAREGEDAAEASAPSAGEEREKVDGDPVPAPEGPAVTEGDGPLGEDAALKVPADPSLPQADGSGGAEGESPESIEAREATEVAEDTAASPVDVHSTREPAERGVMVPADQDAESVDRGDHAGLAPAGRDDGSAQPSSVVDAGNPLAQPEQGGGENEPATDGSASVAGIQSAPGDAAGLPVGTGAAETVTTDPDIHRAGGDISALPVPRASDDREDAYRVSGHDTLQDPGGRLDRERDIHTGGRQRGGRSPDSRREARLAEENELLRTSVRNLEDRVRTLLAEAITARQYRVLAADYDDLRYHYRQANATAARLQADQADLAALVADRERELRQVRQERDELRASRDQLSERVDKLVGELARIRLDPTTTFVSDARPQHHMLVQDFRLLRDQHFHAASASIFDQFLREGHAQPADRRTWVPQIKSRLARVLLVEAGPVLQRRASGPDPLGTAAAELLPMVEQALKPLNVRDWALDASALPAVHALARRCLEFLAQTRAATLPAELWLVERGEQFDPERHEATPECEPEGTVELTVHPGYSVQGRVFGKAVVRTAPAT